jgi:predicted RNA methylase
MNSMLLSPAALAAAHCSAPAVASSDTDAALVAAATLLLADLERGRAIDAQSLRNAMSAGFGGSDAEGAWNWKTAYDACEAAQILFLRKFGPAMRKRAASPSAFLALLGKLAALVPSHTRRSEESEALQQFSTPIELGFVASVAAAITSDDLVLEPSAGTGLLAIHAELAGARLHLNELADARACVLDQLFSAIGVTRYDAAHIHDHLDADIRPTVALMNPPFSVAAHVDGRVAAAAFWHVASALARLPDGGRLVALTGASLSPDNPTWRDSFVRLQERARVVFSAPIDGRVYARHGTTTETRLTVIDRVPADNPTAFLNSPGTASDAGVLLDWATALVPPRPVVTAAAGVAPTMQRVAPRIHPAQRILPSRTSCSATAGDPAAVELTYETMNWAPQSGGRITDALYEEYALQSIRIPGAQPHPTRLVQSAAMASVAPPKPSYRPHLPPAVNHGWLVVRCAARERHLCG